MKRLFLAVTLGFFALFARAPAAMAGTVGVVVTGEPSMQPPLANQIEGWLNSHGHKVVPRPLDTAATNRLIDCFTVDDSSCGRKVVEKSAKDAESVVFARVTREGPTVSISVYWIVKGKPAVGSRRGCEECTEGALRGAADEIMNGLSGAAAVTGRLKLSSKPDGLIVMVDNAKVGVTPLERDLAAGSHSITIVDGTTRVGERAVQIPNGATVEISMNAEYPVDDPRRPPPPPSPSRVLPVVLFIGGGLMLAGGGVGLYLGQKGGHDDPYVYRGATPTGIALLGAGAVAIGVGVWQWRRESRESAPVAMVSSHGGYFGWQGSF